MFTTRIVPSGNTTIEAIEREDNNKKLYKNFGFL